MKIEHTLVDKLICPHCGSVWQNYMLIDATFGDLQCYECKKCFSFSKFIFKWSTEKETHWSSEEALKARGWIPDESH